MRQRTVLCAACVLLWSIPAWSCDAPVFRYALERWFPDLYRVYVFHDGNLTEGERAIIDDLHDRSNVVDRDANLRLEVVDVTMRMDAAQSGPWDLLEGSELPRIALLQPDGAGYGGIVWEAPLTSDSVAALVSSPAREQIADSIITDGHGAVWVLIESGNNETDSSAAALLTDTLAMMAEEVNAKLKTEFTQITNPETRSTDFSLVRVSRDDPAEELLVAMLMRCEPGLDRLADQPMAFPIYGRGRALYALVGSGINEGTIQTATAFVSGVCACEIKDENPGVDMLIVADWDSYPGDPWVDDGVVLTSSAGLSGLAAGPAARRGGSPSVASVYGGETTPALSRPNRVLRTTMLAVGAVVLTALALSVFLVMRRRRTLE